MPVLDNALLAVALAFTPVLAALTIGEPVMKLLARGARSIPRRALPFYGNVVLDAYRQEPGPGGAVLQGLLFGRIAPHRVERRTFETPALVIGHKRDPVHPFSDAGMLAAEMPNAELFEANSLLELRLSPARITDRIAAFLDRVWATPANDGRRAARRRTNAARRAG
jgi:pimeloyl-ACP methyl ester carboxylesterase